MVNKQQVPTNSTSSSFPPESWEVALNYSGLLGVVPSSFSSVIRSLLVDQNKNRATLCPSTRFMIERLAKSRSIKAAMYYGALTFQPLRVEDEPYISERALVNLYQPAELAIIVGISYLYKRARKLCDPGQFTMITNRFQECADLGAYVGYAIPNISPFVAIITGAMPMLGLAPFLFYDRRGFIDYTRHLKHTKATLDLEYELKRWSCTSIQIAAVMMQALGLGVSTATAFSTGLTGHSGQLINETPEAIKYQTAQVWIKSLEEGGGEPQIVHKAEFYPSKQALNTLLTRVSELREKGSPYCWLLRGSYDISPEQTPQLFKSGNSDDLATGQLEMVADEIKEASRMVSEVEADLKELLSDEE